MTFERAWRAAFALFLIFVTWQTLTPDPEESKSGLALARYLAAMLFGDAGYADKIAHFLAYATLGGLAGMGDLRAFGKRRFSVLLLFLYGLLLEWLQGVGGVRDAEIVDALANATGAVTGFAVSMVVARFRVKPKAETA